MLIENAGVKGTSSQLNFKQDRPTADYATFKSYVQYWDVCGCIN